MKVKFIIDKKYDLEKILELLKFKDNLHSQKIRFDFSFRSKSFLDLNERTVEKKVFKRYAKTFPYLRKTKTLYQKSWDEINNEFFKATENITGYQWKYKNYFCILSPFHKGISSWGGNKIVRSWQENPYTMRKITAHELLISHIFTIFERNFKEENLSNKQKWALAEISAWAITGLENRMLKFWPWISEEEEKYPLNHNYPELYKLQKALKLKYEKKKNFKRFLKKSIQLLKAGKNL